MTATFTIRDAAPQFPVGTVLGLYPSYDQAPKDSAPAGTQVTTATVASTGSATFTGIAYDTDYIAAASVSGSWKWRKLRTIASPTTNDSTLAVIREAPINVKYPDYGAVGDGVTNDTAAVQAAYAALPAAGGTLYFPGRSTYMLGNAASMGIFTKPLQIIGDGAGTSILKSRDTNAQHFIWMKGNGSGARNVTIDGQRSTQSSNGGSAIQFSGTGSGVLVPIKDVAIVDCEVKGGGFDAIGLTAVNGGTVRGNIVRNVFDTGIDLVEGTKNVSIQDNTVYCDGRFGIALDTADAVNYGPVTGCTIAGNTVVMSPSSDTRYGILLQTASDCSVTGNTVDCSAAGLQGIRFDNEFVRGTCKANVVIGGTAVTRGICIEGLTQQLKMVSVTDNTVRDVTTASQSGIGVDNAIGVTISGNQVENCKRGINSEGSSAKPGSAVHVHHNTLRNCDIGVRFGGSTGASTAAIGPNSMLGTFSFRYAVDSVWTVHTADEWDKSFSTGTLTGRIIPVELVLFAEPRTAEAISIPTSQTTYDVPGAAFTASTTQLLSGASGRLVAAYWTLIWTPGNAGCGGRLCSADAGPTNITQIAEFTGDATATPVNKEVNITTAMQAITDYTALGLPTGSNNKTQLHQFKSNGTVSPTIYASKVLMLFEV